LVSEARCRPVLVIDEAHHLSPDVLENLRLLTDDRMDAENRLCLLLLGQTELRRRPPWLSTRRSHSVSSAAITCRLCPATRSTPT